MCVPGIVAGGLSLLLTPLVLVVLRRLRVLDHPNERSSHDEPVIRGGGIAFALASVLTFRIVVGPGLADAAVGVVVAAVALGTVGLAEDLWGVASLPRFMLQLVAGALALVWLLSDLSGPLTWRVAFALGCLFALASYANAFNFMDGINGISAVQSIVAGAAWAWLGHVRDVDALVWGGSILAGASLGFLPYNFPKARLFLGDVGSYFIGGWQAALVVVGLRAGLPPEAVAAPLALYLADTGTTLLRRVAAGEAWHRPHRDHTYQRLIRRGWSHPRTTSLVGSLVATCSLLGILALGPQSIRALADGLLALVLLSYLMLPRLLSRRRSGSPRPA